MHGSVIRKIIYVYGPFSSQPRLTTRGVWICPKKIGHGRCGSAGAESLRMPLMPLMPWGCTACRGEKDRVNGTCPTALPIGLPRPGANGSNTIQHDPLVAASALAITGVFQGLHGDEVTHCVRKILKDSISSRH